MQRQLVSSSNVRSVGYDPLNRVLEVEFLNKSIYHYLGVPSSTYASLMKAESKGGYLSRQVKGVYSYRRVR
jgi:hypothetical protein